MTQITRDLISTLREDIDAALIAVAKKHNVAISAGKAKFNDREVTFQLLIVGETSADGASARDIKALADLNALGKLYGADPAWAGKSFRSGSQSFTVIGLLPSRTKRSILARRADGKDFIFEPEQVARLISIPARRVMA